MKEVDRITAGTVVAFREPARAIEPGRPYTVEVEQGIGLFITDDAAVKRPRLVQGKEVFRNLGGYIVLSTRTALIEALKAHFITLKDVPMHGPDLTENRQKACISMLLSSGFGIKAEVVPGPSTVTFTELANNP